MTVSHHARNRSPLIFLIPDRNQRPPHPPHPRLKLQSPHPPHPRLKLQSPHPPHPTRTSYSRRNPPHRSSPPTDSVRDELIAPSPSQILPISLTDSPHPSLVSTPSPSLVVILSTLTPTRLFRFRLENQPKASSSIQRIISSSKWRITGFKARHSHRLETPTKSRCLRSHRSVPDSQRHIVKGLHKVGVMVSRSLEFMVEEVGGHDQLGFIKRDLQNALPSRRMSKYDVGATAFLDVRPRRHNFKHTSTIICSACLTCKIYMFKHPHVINTRE
ncbi:hypothetical protein ACLOJK_037848 [Asimina triloba]